MARELLGPTGETISVAGLRRAEIESTGRALAKLDEDAMWAEVQKRVKTQGTTLSQVYDPARGKPKPTSVTPQTLRMMAQRCEWLSAAIKKRCNQVAAAEWSIVPQDEEDESVGTKALCLKIENLLKRPSMHGSRPSSRSWRQFISEVVKDRLVLDAGQFEKEWTLEKWIAALYPVDAATIAPNMDARGGYHADAYVQTVEGQITARLGMEDLCWIMDNPQTDVRFAGYGFSPVETLIVSVTSELYGSKYNASYFEKGSVPEGMINLGPEVSPEDVNAFRLYWMNEIMGRPWAIPIIGGSTADWIPWRASNKDMEFMKYQEWLLQKICAVINISPKEMGQIDDVNRSTAESVDTGEEETGERPELDLITDAFEVDVMGEYGLGVHEYVKFQFAEPQESEDIVDQRCERRVAKGMMTRAEWRDTVGLDPAEHEGLDEFLVDAEVYPLPQGEDLEALGAANQLQADREEKEAQFAMMQEDQGRKNEDQDRKNEESQARQKAWASGGASKPETRRDKPGGRGESEARKTADQFAPRAGDSLQQHLERHAPAGVDHFAYESNAGHIHLQHLVVPKEQRGQGHGSRFMHALNGYADAHGKTVTLNPNPVKEKGGTTSRGRLVKFYGAHGFVENKGRRADHALPGGMYRQPQTLGKRKVPRPPNLRDATGRERCGSCKMFSKGVCWGYGNCEVRRDQVCDSWATSVGKTFDRPAHGLLEDERDAEAVWGEASLELLESIKDILDVPVNA